MKKDFSDRLLAWYRENRRELPWRLTHDPYRIWVSEIMLQQTQVKTVIPYYENFLKKFPTVRKLAGASLDTVLKAWEGLGYYSRARNLHRAAQEVVGKFRGRLPRDFMAILSLPGIGRYTAGAIASIAYGERVPILDGNVERVLCRYFAIGENPKEKAVRERLWQLSESLLPDQDISDFNQALMELGATLCTPEKPACSACPMQGDCQAYRKGVVHQLPMRRKKGKVPLREKHAIILWNGDQFLLKKRPPHGLLGGLWEIPLVEGTLSRVILKKSSQGVRQFVEDFIGEDLPCSFSNSRQVIPPSPAGANDLLIFHAKGKKVSHQYTHFKEIVIPLHFRMATQNGHTHRSMQNAGRSNSTETGDFTRAGLWENGDSFRWVSSSTVSQLALTKTTHKLLLSF